MTQQLPIATKTGEKFIMHLPAKSHGDDEEHQLINKETHEGWNVLRDTIERLGGEVTVLEGQQELSNENIRDAMFVRDTALHMPHGQGRGFLFGEYNHAAMLPEKEKLWDHLEREGTWRMTPVPGDFDVGNLVYDRSRNTLYWGVTNAAYVTNVSQHKEERLPDPKAEAKRRIELKLKYAKHTAIGVNDTANVLHGHPALEVDGKPYKVVPMFIPDEFAYDSYHLDGVLGILPTGQAVVCWEALSKTARNALEKTIGKDNIVAIDYAEAMRGATNFITVGSNIVTPFASPALKQKFEQFGYHVVDPASLGLREDLWDFAEGGFVRCATLKSSPDMGFPSTERAAAVPRMAK